MFLSFFRPALALAASALLLFACTQAHGATTGPAHLRVNDLPAPLGLDDPAPRFSWQLDDPAAGAKQSAYEIQVASNAALLAQDKADVWTSGRVSSSASLGIRYSGPALAASTHYLWRVKLWNAAGKAYAPSAVSSFETGLMNAAAWKASWIGYLTPEETAVRQTAATWVASPDTKTLVAEKPKQERYAYRQTIHLNAPVRRATLYVTGQDTVAAWVNGEQVLTEQPLLACKQMPWKKFVAVPVKLHPGQNTLAVEVLHYVENPNGMATGTPPPMMATLVAENADGSWSSFGSDTTWKSATHAANGWTAAGFDDSQWKTAVPAETAGKMLTEPLGKPWLPGTVKELRRSFAVSAPIRSARLYATALGVYEVYLNGQRVGNDVMAPGWTDYRQFVHSQSYDVTALLQPGENALGALLGPGWYASPLEWFQQPNNYGLTPPALRAQLRIEHTDGAVEWIATDDQWQARASSIVFSEIYDGETQDARLFDPTWNLIQNRQKNWQKALVVEPAAVKIVAENFQPIRVERTLHPKAITEPRPGVWIFDFGQNLSGVATLRASGPAGSRVQLRFGEMLNPDGTLYTENLRTAKATDTFILAGKSGDKEEFTPHFTFHGFRYVELTGLPETPQKDTLSVSAFHTDAPFTARLVTGNAMINQLWSNITWGQRSNFIGLPTDCPQRDERLGWMADAQVFWRTAGYNMDLAAFSRKFSADMRSTQSGTPYYGIFAPGTIQPVSGSGAGWSDAGVIIPYTSWLQTGDQSILAENWAAMELYMNAIAQANPDGLWKNESGIPFGDWLSPEGKTDYVLIATASWAWDATLMRRMAHALGKSDDEQKYEALFAKIRAAFQQKFIHPDGFIPGADNSPSIFGGINNPNAKSAGGDTQTSYVLALHMNLLPENLRAAAAKRLVEKIHANHDLLGTGFLGTPYLLEELTRAGYKDLAYKLLLNTGYPSWGYMVEHGATTMWERWNGDQMISDPAMNSYNHYAYGAVADWIYRYAASIDASSEDPGFHTVVLNPHFDPRLGSLSFTYDSAYGQIHSEWVVRGSAADWRITIPANATGWIAKERAAAFKLNGKPLVHAHLAERQLDGRAGLVLQPGSYTFTGKLTE